MEFDPTFASFIGKFTFGAFLPVFIFTILAEALTLQKISGHYPWKNFRLSLIIGLGHVITQAAAQGIIFGLIAQEVYQLRLFTIPASTENWQALIPLFFLTELAFYFEHRCAHGIRIMWASHSVHHSTEHMNVAAAFRLAWTPILSGIFLFYLPIIWIGYEPKIVFGLVSASLAYQFFIHTELIGRMGWLEWFLNTPSAHRVHHASNKQYLDKNFGGVLMIWDHLFGTYQAELPNVRIKYGVTSPVGASTNPFVVVYGEFSRLLKDVWRQPNLNRRIKTIFSPPD